MPRELVIRAPIVDDADAVSDLINTCSLHDSGASRRTPEEVRRYWQLPALDPATNAWLVDSPDERIAGYIDVACPAPYDHFYADGCVHPDYRGRGIGRALIRLAEWRARQVMEHAPARAEAALIVRTDSQNTAADRLFTREGFALARHFWRMSVELTGAPAEPVSPEGITIRSMVTGQEERAVYDAVEEAFQDHWDHQTLDFDTWLSLHVGDPTHYDPTLWLVATTGSDTVGAALCQPRTAESPTEGWVGTLAVRRAWRHRGIGDALLRHALSEFARRGTRSAALSVDAASPTGATRLYERVGMRVVRRFDRYRKELQMEGDYAGRSL
jgi:mycothiol synthase